MIIDISGNVDGDSVIDLSIDLNTVAGIQLTPYQEDEGNPHQVRVFLKGGSDTFFLLPEIAAKKLITDWKAFYACNNG